MASVIIGKFGRQTKFLIPSRMLDRAADGGLCPGGIFPDQVRVHAVPGHIDFEVFPEHENAEKFHRDDLELIRTRERMEMQETYVTATGDSSGKYFSFSHAGHTVKTD